MTACGGGPSSPSASGTTITITPVQAHTDCPAINDVGTLAPGQSRLTGPPNVRRTCGFHDHNNENDPAYKGVIILR